jgi:Sugar kinases, ribokinase family
MSIGEVLWDVLPDGKELGGAPTNVAWHCAQLGADAHVASAVGKDPLGDEILESLKRMRLDLSAVSVIPDKPTSTVDAVISPEGNATYVIHENVAWDAMPASPAALALAAKADGVNFGSLGQRGEAGRLATQAIVDATPAACLRIFDINLRTGFYSKRGSGRRPGQGDGR